MKTLSHTLAIFPLFLVCAAQAQPVYRCGNSYSSEPCAGGNAAPLKIDGNGPSADQRAATEANTLRQSQLSEDFSRTRANSEAQRRRDAQTYAMQPAPAQAQQTGSSRVERYRVVREVRITYSQGQTPQRSGSGSSGSSPSKSAGGSLKK